MAAYTARTYNQLCAARGTDLSKMADEFALIQAAIKDNLNVALADGAAAGDITVTGMTATSRIVFVGHLTTKAAIATLADLTAECTPGAGKITTSTTDTTNDQLMVIWIAA